MPLNLIFTQPGTFTIDDNGIPGDNISVIRDSNGVVIFTFAHPVDALGFTVNVPGVNLIINFTDSLGAADFSIGDLTNSAITPDSIVMKNVRTTGDVTLVSNGSITEGGNDYAADIVAGDLIMSAQTGVGTAGNAIETQTSFIEAETVTGGISLKQHRQRPDRRPDRPGERPRRAHLRQPHPHRDRLDLPQRHRSRSRVPILRIRRPKPSMAATRRATSP